MAARVLSCFIDVSGDFGPNDYRAPYYYVAMVLHDQSEEITDKIIGMEERAANLGFPHHAIHTGPLIRREKHMQTIRWNSGSISSTFCISLPFISRFAISA